MPRSVYNSHEYQWCCSHVEFFSIHLEGIQRKWEVAPQAAGMSREKWREIQGMEPYGTMPFSGRASCYPSTFQPLDQIWLVVWNMNFMTFHEKLGIIIPTDELTYIFSSTFHLFSILDHIPAIENCLRPGCTPMSGTSPTGRAWWPSDLSNGSYLEDPRNELLRNIGFLYPINGMTLGIRDL